MFFAILPDQTGLEDIRALTAQLDAKFGIRADLRPDRVLHISGQPVERYRGLPKDVVAAAQRAGAALRARPCTVTFDQLRNLGRKGEGSQPLALCCGDGAPDLMAIWHGLAGVMQACWLLPKPAAALTPHLSLLYSRQRLPEGPLETPITLAVRHLALVRSLQGQTRYKPLGRWPLRG
ncbi:MAG TPA: hypothetical protein VGM87_14870 [Roseomonas sp.]